MNLRLFNPDELKALATPYPVLIRQKIILKQIDAALSLCEEMKHSQVALHDFFAESCTVLWSWAGKALGEETVEDMFRYIFEQSARRQFFDAACAMAPPHLAVILLAKSWRAHSCFAAGDHPGNFSISEDPEKFTFHLNPCGSGLKLWKKGWYEPGMGGALSDQERTWTYQRKGLPYYCIHCPFLNEILPYESDYGTLMWPVDPPETLEDTCKWHIYKDRNKIPGHYYLRLDLKKKNVPANKYLVPGRTYFSDSQLSEMSIPMTDQIAEKIKNGKYPEAIRLCSQVKDEFLALHDLYVNMLVSTLTFIAEKSGESGLENALRLQFEKCVQKQFCDLFTRLTPKDKVVFLARKIFGTDICNGSGYYKGKFYISETDDEVIFTLDPCGSGGRLIRSGAYAAMPRLKKQKEFIEKAIICSASGFFPLPEMLFAKLFPYIVNHFTQRKPHNQGKTREIHSWSFSMADVPFFCCQCGVIHERFGNKGIRISPPIGKDNRCIWRIDKHYIGSRSNYDS
jgi:hypothetical protein